MWATYIRWLEERFERRINASRVKASRIQASRIQARSKTFKMFFKATFIAFFIHQLVSFTHCSPVDFSAPTTTNSIEARAPKSFAHPGVFLDKAQLNFIKGKVNSGAEPWSTAYKSMLFNDLASLTRSARPWATVECGRDEIPNKGCTDELYDGVAAYAMSLAWYISGNAKYAQKAISYMNIWAKTLKSHTEFNANLQTAWAAVNWARAAEIIRHTNAGWSYSDITAFEKMLREVYLPPVIGGSEYNGNWELGLGIPYLRLKFLANVFKPRCKLR